MNSAAKLCLCGGKLAPGELTSTGQRRRAKHARAVEASRWLVAAGLPQYVQLFAESQLKDSDVNTLSSDYQFLNADWLLTVESRLNSLLECCRTSGNFSTDLLRGLYVPRSTLFICALSRKWQYDRVGGRWRRCTSASSLSRTCARTLFSLSGGPTEPLGGSCSRLVSIETDSVSPSLADVDSGNHVTSGYESETSPTSTATNTVGDGPTSSNNSSPSNCTKSVHVGLTDGKQSAGQSPPSPLDRVTSSAGKRQQDDVSRHSSTQGPQPVLRSRPTASEPLPRSSSFYDNLSLSEVLADPQTELEMILDDLRRNITALDAALGATDLALSVSQDAPATNNTVVGSSPSDQSFHSVPSFEIHHVHSTSSVESQHQEDDANGTNTQQELPSSCSPRDNSFVNELNQRRQTHSSDTWWLVGTTLSRDRRCGGHVSWLNLSAAELTSLRQLSIIQLTSLLEKLGERLPAVSICSRALSKYLESAGGAGQMDQSGTTSGVFGVSLERQLRRTGRPIPDCIERAMQYISQNAAHADGLFRRPGVLSRVQKLQDAMTAEPDSLEFDEETDVYSVADIVKRYYRDLPESPLTESLASLLIDLFVHVPEKYRLEAVRATILLLPDAKFAAVYQLMTFLRHIATLSDQHQMTAGNLAVCFLPSLFRISDYQQVASPNGAVTNRPSGDEYQLRYKSALTCLAALIENAETLTEVGEELLCALTGAAPLDELMLVVDSSGDILQRASHAVDVSAYTERLMNDLIILATAERDDVVWVEELVDPDDVRVCWQAAVDDDSRLQIWSATADIEAPPVEVLSRLTGRDEGLVWNSAVTGWTTVAELGLNTDLVEYIVHVPELQRPRRCCVLRSWRYDKLVGRGVLVSTSVRRTGGTHRTVDVSETASLHNEVEATVKACHYLVEPCGTGMSRLVYVSSIDFSGHSPEWYSSVYGRICANHVVEIRNSFRHDASNEWSQGPETKV